MWLRGIAHIANNTARVWLFEPRPINQVAFLTKRLLLLYKETRKNTLQCSVWNMMMLSDLFRGMGRGKIRCDPLTSREMIY